MRLARTLVVSSLAAVAPALAAGAAVLALARRTRIA